MINDKSIKELVELVEEGKLSEIVFEDEIEKVQYVIFKNQIGVGIQKTDMNKKKEITKPYQSTVMDGPPNPILKKAMDYMINPYPKVSDAILQLYKSTLEDEISRITKIEDRVGKEADEMRDNLKVLEDDMKDNHYFRDKRQGLIEHITLELGKRNLGLERIMRRKGEITDFIKNGK